MNDTERLATKLASDFRGIPEPRDEVWTAAPALKLIDCVLSLNRKYDAVVLPRVQRFRSKQSGIQTMQDLLELIRSYPSPAEFMKAELDYADPRRAQTLVEVLEYMIDVAQDCPGSNDDERLRAWAVDARPGDFLAMDVRGFKLAGFQYLRMLFGAQTTKPDVHIIRYVSEALGREVADVQALYLLERAAAKTGLPLRSLDVAIWERGARR